VDVPEAALTSPPTDNYEEENFEGYDDYVFDVDFDETHTPDNDIECARITAVNILSENSVVKEQEGNDLPLGVAVQRSNNDESDKSSEDYDTSSDFEDDSEPEAAVNERRTLSADNKTKSLTLSTSRPQLESSEQAQLELLTPPAEKGPPAHSLQALAETSPFDRIKLLSGASRRALREKTSSSGKVKKVRGGQASLSSSGSFTHYLTVVDPGLQQLVT